MMQDESQTTDQAVPTPTPFEDLVRFFERAWAAFWAWADEVDRNTPPATHNPRQRR